MDPLSLFREAQKNVPFLRYAWGVIGLVAVGTIVVTLANNDPKSAFFYFVVVLAATVVIALVARNIRSQDSRGPARIIVWASTLCFVAAMVMTLSAWAIGCPEGWARLVGATPACFEKANPSDVAAIEATPQPAPQPAPQPKPVSQKFKLEDRSDDCGVSRSKADQLCLAPEATLLEWDGPHTTSANCGSKIGVPKRIPDKPNCLTVTVTLRGCGYDEFLGIKNCKGRGWIGGEITLKGEIPN